MATPQKYTHDKTVLMLLSVNTFLAVLIAILVILSLTGSADRALTIEHRPQLGLDANRVGSGLDMVSLVVFPLMVVAAYTVLSVRTYPIRRNLSIVVLGMATLLVVLSGIVSYYLLQS